MNKTARYFHTLRYLKAEQLFYQLYYRFRRQGRRVLRMTCPLQLERQGFSVQLVPFVTKQQVYNNGTFTFLNIAHFFGENAGSIDWEFGKYGKLWLYNLNYFDVLCQPGMTRESGLDLIESFLAVVNPESVGLEPYLLSLRGINWIKFLSRHQVQRADINGALFAHYTILEKNLEYHLLGNHLLENAFSLLYGAFFFWEKRWFVKSMSLLVRELDEQILGDGAHFELSPMYHQILLDRLLEGINLLQHNACFTAERELLHLFEAKALVMLAWLKEMTFSNGSLPHLNDATDGIAPSSQQLFEYAARLGLMSETVQHVHLKESGYRKYCTSLYECLLDVGSIGPLYIPGHAHADTLNFVLQVKGKPWLVDCGISTYEKNAIRDEERGTGAHNTVVVNGCNSSDVWGGFRVGQRAVVKILEDKERVVSASHDGYKQFGVTHTRQWVFHDEHIVLNDTISGQAESIEAFFHLHHTLNPEVSGNRVVTVDADIIFEGSQNIEIRNYMQALGYNRRVEALCAVVTFSNTLITNIVCKK